MNDQIDENANGNIGQLGNKIIGRILSFLGDLPELLQAEQVCKLWQKIIADGELWSELYYQKIEEFPDWKVIDELLESRNEVHKNLLPLEGEEGFRARCCTIRDTIEALFSVSLKKNWVSGCHADTLCSLEGSIPEGQTGKKDKAPACPVDFSLNDRWIIRTKPNGRIAVRNRWAMQEETEAEILPDENVPVDSNNNHPVFESVQFYGSERLVGVGRMGTRQILFLFKVKHEAPSSVKLKIHAWRCIYDSSNSAGYPYEYDLKNCIRCSETRLAVCGSKVRDKSTAVTVMDLRGKTPQVVFKNQEIPARLGTLCDFAVDGKNLVLLFGTKENPRSKRMDRYRVQVRSSVTFDMIVTFTLPVISADKCLFHYSNGYVATGSDDSPIRIWNTEKGTCDGAFHHGEHLAALRIVSDKLILTCNQQGSVRIWDFQAALESANFNCDPDRVLVVTLEAPKRHGKVTQLHADVCQIAMALQMDAKSSCLHVMDFLSAVEDVGKSENVRPRRKRRYPL